MYDHTSVIINIVKGSFYPMGRNQEEKLSDAVLFGCWFFFFFPSEQAESWPPKAVTLLPP